MAIKRINSKITGADLKGIEGLKERVRKLRNTSINIGVFAGNYPNGTSIASVGLWHEFGSVSNSLKVFKYKGKTIFSSGYPARSWLRMPLKSKRFKVLNDREFLKSILIVAMSNDKELDKWLNYIGLEAVQIIREAFLTGGFGKWDNNMNPLYVELKGSADSPLMDTSLLVSSVEYKIEN